MLFRHSVDLPQHLLPNPSLSGWELISPKDGVHFSCYEARIPDSRTVILQAPPGSCSNHIYYCIDGEGVVCLMADGKEEEKHSIKHGHVVALSSKLTGKLSTSSPGGMRLFVIYCDDDEHVNNNNKRQVVRSLKEIDGTYRDINHGAGHSRRFLLKRDGFPVSVHLTTIVPGSEINIEYRNHLEGVYFYAGNTTYIWNGGKASVETKVSNGNGTLVCMDENDAHTVDTTAAGEDAKCVCVFYPALVGLENHTYTAEGFSSYDLVED